MCVVDTIWSVDTNFYGKEIRWFQILKKTHPAHPDQWLIFFTQKSEKRNVQTSVETTDMLTELACQKGNDGNADFCR